jgi:hypothetical protein
VLSVSLYGGYHAIAVFSYCLDYVSSVRLQPQNSRGFLPFLDLRITSFGYFQQLTTVAIFP